MNLSKIAVAALGFNYSPWFVQGQEEKLGPQENLEIKHRVGPYELHPIGNDIVSIGSNDPSSYAWIFVHLDTTEPTMEVRLHFEGDFSRDSPIIEVFSGVEDGAACDTGTPIDIQHNFAGVGGESPLLNMRVTSDGAIGQIWAYMDLYDNSRWTPVNVDNPEVAGTFKACARVSMQHDGEYISFVDTSVSVYLDNEGTFQTFANDITVLGVSTKSLEDSETKQIGMESYLCGPSDSADPNRAYKIGQSFSICVGPTEAEKSNYEYIAVVGFEEVKCGGIDVVLDGQETALTTVTPDPENYMKSGGDGVELGVSSFETVVTPDYYRGLSQGSVTCSGTVELSFTDPNPTTGPRFSRAGCFGGFSNPDLGETWTTIGMFGGGAEVDVEKCNDHCGNLGYDLFVLTCPHKFPDEYPKYGCFCPYQFFGTPDSDCGLQGFDFVSSHILQTDYTCTLTYQTSDEYMFGLGTNTEYGYLESPVYYVEKPGRRLTTSFSTNSGDLLQRHLQESGNKVDNSGSFGTEVLLSREDDVDAAFVDLAAPAADTTSTVPSTVMATAASAIVAAAFLV